MVAKRLIPTHTIIKFSKVKDKERILKAAREVSYQMVARWEREVG